MTAEINILIAAQDHQAELLAEADARRLIRPTELPTWVRPADQATPDHPPPPARRRSDLRLIVRAPSEGSEAPVP